MMSEQKCFCDFCGNETGIDPYAPAILKGEKVTCLNCFKKGKKVGKNKEGNTRQNLKLEELLKRLKVSKP